MLELEPHHSHHHHHHDHTPGLQLYGSRCNPYTFTITRIPRPLFLDNLHSRQGYNAFSRERFQAWAQASMQQSDDKAIQPHASRPTERLKKPFVATAAFPADIPRLVEIEFAAFQDELVNHHLSYRDGSNPDHTNRTVDFYKSCMKHMRTNSLPAGSANHGANFVRRDSKVDLATPDSSTEGYRFRKVLDPQTGEIIAFAKSEITTLTDEDHASPLDVGHESEPEMNRAWFALNEKLHRSYCGFRKHLYFGMLATHPSYQHRGAATALMSELIAEADALGLEIYCEATRTGRPMYEKYGFVPVETLKFDPAAFGRHDLGVEVQTVMIRGVGGVWDGKRI